MLLVVVLLALALGGAGGFLLGRRTAGKSAEVERQAGRFAEALASFGSQLAALPFDPASADASPDQVAEYQQALDAYDRAAAAADRGGEQAVREVKAALGAGRNALVRLDARRRGVPIPLEAAPPLSAEELPMVHAADRHSYEGVGNAEVMIDRPVAGETALVSYTVTCNDSSGNFCLTTVTRTEQRVEELSAVAVVALYNRGESYQGRAALIPDATHVKVEADPDFRWTLQIQPRGAARVFDGSARGKGSDVLVHAGRPKTVLAQFRAEDASQVDWLGNCGCTSYCECDDDLMDVEWTKTSVFAEGDFRGKLLLLPGFIIIHTSGDWSLDALQP